MRRRRAYRAPNAFVVGFTNLAGVMVAVWLFSAAIRLVGGGG